MKLRFLDNIYDNPVFVREIRRRLRGRALVIAIISYVLLMCGAAFLTILVMYGHVETITNLPQKLRQITELGRYIFIEVLVLCGLLTLVLAPVMALNIVLMEREKGTFDFIKVTTIRPGSYILGNFLSIIVYVLLIFVCALPVISLGFLFGGLAPIEILKAFGILLVYSLLLSAAGLYLSVISEKMRLGLARMFAVFMIIVFSGPAAAYYLVPFLMPYGFPTPRSPLIASFLGTSVSPLLVTIPWTIILVLLLLNAASRKLYDIERRPMSYGQFFLLFLLGLFTLWGYVFWTSIDLQKIRLVLLITSALLALAVLIFSIGRVEVGDDVWRLKKRFKFLRRSDEGLYYIVGLLLIAGGVTFCWPVLVHSGSAALYYTLYFSYALITVLILFYYQTGQVATALGANRRTGLRVVFLIMVMLTLVMPVVSRFIHDIIKPRVYLKFLYSFNPLYTIESFHDIFRQAPGSPHNFWLEGGSQIVFYAILFIALRILTIKVLKQKFPQFAPENLLYEFKDEGGQE